MVAKSILLIESEISLREVLGACLREFGGWKITFSSSIKEGISLCEDTSPDLILVDASSPETDALLFIEQLKSYSAQHSIPLVLISSRANWFSPQELRNMGFSGAINKPFNPSTLPANIAQMLNWNDQDL